MAFAILAIAALVCGEFGLIWALGWGQPNCDMTVQGLVEFWATLYAITLAGVWLGRIAAEALKGRCGV